MKKIKTNIIIIICTIILFAQWSSGEINKNATDTKNIKTAWEKLHIFDKYWPVYRLYNKNTNETLKMVMYPILDVTQTGATSSSFTFNFYIDKQKEKIMLNHINVMNLTNIPVIALPEYMGDKNIPIIVALKTSQKVIYTSTVLDYYDISKGPREISFQTCCQEVPTEVITHVDVTGNLLTTGIFDINQNEMEILNESIITYYKKTNKFEEKKKAFDEKKKELEKESEKENGNENNENNENIENNSEDKNPNTKSYPTSTSIDLDKKFIGNVVAANIKSAINPTEPTYDETFTNETNKNTNKIENNENKTNNSDIIINDELIFGISFSDYMREFKRDIIRANWLQAKGIDNSSQLLKTHYFFYHKRKIIKTFMTLLSLKIIDLLSKDARFKDEWCKYLEENKLKCIAEEKLIENQPLEDKITEDANNENNNEAIVEDNKNMNKESSKGEDKIVTDKPDTDTGNANPQPVEEADKEADNAENPENKEVSKEEETEKELTPEEIEKLRAEKMEDITKKASLMPKFFKGYKIQENVFLQAVKLALNEYGSSLEMKMMDPELANIHTVTPITSKVEEWENLVVVSDIPKKITEVTKGDKIDITVLKDSYAYAWEDYMGVRIDNGLFVHKVSETYGVRPVRVEIVDFSANSNDHRLRYAIVQKGHELDILKEGRMFEFRTEMDKSGDLYVWTELGMTRINRHNIFVNVLRENTAIGNYVVELNNNIAKDYFGSSDAEGEPKYNGDTLLDLLIPELPFLANELKANDDKDIANTQRIDNDRIMPCSESDKLYRLYGEKLDINKKVEYASDEELCCRGFGQCTFKFEKH